jgi:hypothetical protein
MIPYNATDTDDAEAIVPWTNIGLIVLNFLVFFYELVVGGAGGDNALAGFIQSYGLVPCDFTGHCAVAAGTAYPLWNPVIWTWARPLRWPNAVSMTTTYRSGRTGSRTLESA